MPEGSQECTFDQFIDAQASRLQLMLQALLAERFNLKRHREQRQLPVYAMTITKPRPKLKKTAEPEIIQFPDGSQRKNRSLLWTPALSPTASGATAQFR